MKLKKTWLGYGIWGIYSIFTIFLIAYSAFNSGLLPTQQKILYTVAFSVLVILAVATITILFWKLNDNFFYEDKKILKILFVLASVLIIAGAFAIRIYIVSTSGSSLSGNLNLYESAKIGSNAIISKSDLLSYVYSNFLKFILGFTGNSDIVVPLFQVFIQMLMLIALYFAILNTMGSLATLVATAYFAFVPVFTNDFFEIYAKNIFYLLFAVELLILSLYLRGESKDLYKHKASYILFICIGLLCGFMFFIDAGTAIAGIFLFAALFTDVKEIHRVLLHIITILLSSCVSFLLMLLQQGGINGFNDSFNAWHVQYFKSLSTLALFTFYNDYKYIYLVTMVLMSIVIIAFFKGGKRERVTPWLLLTVLVAVIIPFLGSTRLNCQFMVTLFYGIAISAGFSCITMRETQEFVDNEEETAFETVNEETEGASLLEDVDYSEGEVNTMEVVRPESDANKKTNEKVLEEKEVVEQKTEKDADKVVGKKAEKDADKVAEPEVVKEVTRREVLDEDFKEITIEPKEEKVRFVPEGMVVPEGSEDEEDFVAPSRMKMPSFKETAPISLNRTNKKKEETSSHNRRDDFAIDIKNGDDFAI